ncbi:MAG: restriction endonuclease subunit S [Bacteroidaceae bacterium]|nr:restriction endonuclease subunit S [Bacteroidaceae bacterium]
MKEGWEKKKLGEVCCKITDGSHNPPKGIDVSEFKMISSQNVFDDQLIIDSSTVRYLSLEDFEKENKRTNVEKNDVLLTIVGTVGRSCVISGEEGKIALQRSVALLKPSSKITSRFLMFALISKRDELNREAHGIAQKGIYLKQLTSLSIPVPPLSVQESIVSELDMLSGIISKHKALQEEYDRLEQSIFYDMFGDPVTNEKGWEVKELGSMCEVTSAKRVLIEEVVNEGIPFLRGTELMALCKKCKNEKINFSLFITQEHYDRLKAITGVPKQGDLLIPSINADGLVWIVDTGEPFYFKDGRVLWVHVNNEYYNSIALQKIIHYILEGTYSTMASGATFAELKLFVLRELQVPLPPLSLQQSFADKISAIEQMKAKNKAAQEEAEMLFNERMAYYF